jgi:hypothetical protein
MSAASENPRLPACFASVTCYRAHRFLGSSIPSTLPPFPERGSSSRNILLLLLCNKLIKGRLSEIVSEFYESARRGGSVWVTLWRELSRKQKGLNRKG